MLQSMGSQRVRHNLATEQLRIFIGRADAEAPIPWPPDARAGTLEKTQMLGKIEGRWRRG